jgi:paraquat-inducible protein B
MNKTAEPHLKENTHFWVVRPRLSLTSLSGLDTLVSGDYIEMDPGDGNSAHAYKGLEEPPVVRSDVPGTTYTLTTDTIGSISSGSLVFFRGIDVGEVINYTFDGLDKGFTIKLFVKKPYDALVRDATRFWNASGISLTTGADGFKLQIESLAAVIGGGVAFNTPDSGQPSQVAKAEAVFPLYADRSAADEAVFTTRARAIVEFEGSVRGLAVGSPVEVQGIKIGQVVDFHLVVDAATKKVSVPVVIEIDLNRVGIINQPADQFGKGALAANLVALGLRAQLRTSNLLTGQLLVALDFFPDAPPAQIVQTDTYPKLPTVPTELESLTRSVSAILDKLAALPLADVVKNASSTLDAARKLLRDADTESAPLLTSLHKTSDAANLVLNSMGDSYGKDSQVRGELAELIRQLQDTAKSVTRAANYLEAHPESLVRGKGSTQ